MFFSLNFPFDNDDLLLYYFDFLNEEFDYIILITEELIEKIILLEYCK